MGYMDNEDLKRITTIFGAAITAQRAMRANALADFLYMGGTIRKPTLLDKACIWVGYKLLASAHWFGVYD